MAPFTTAELDAPMTPDLHRRIEARLAEIAAATGKPLARVQRDLEDAAEESAKAMAGHLNNKEQNHAY